MAVTTIEQLKQKALEIKNETREGYNTANRIGTFFTEVANNLETFEDEAAAEQQEAFETAEAARDALVDAKVGDITELQEDLYNKSEVETSFLYTDKFVNKSGELITLNNYYTTEQILLKKGFTITATITGYKNNVSVISKVVSEIYIPLVVCEETGQKTFTYTNDSDSDIYVALSGAGKPNEPKNVYTSKDEIESINSSLESVKETLSELHDEEYKSVTFLRTDAFLKNGEIISISGYYITNNIVLNPYEEITIYATGYSTNVDILSKYENGSYSTLVKSTGSDSKWYSYTNTNSYSINVAISGMTKNGQPIVKIVKDAIKSLQSSQIDLRNDINKIYPSSISLSVFEKIGVVGDSFASGVICDESNNSVQRYEKSWIQQIARRNGMTAYNLSQGGLTTRSWLTNPNGLQKLNNTEPLELYICALGINDVVKLGMEYIGSITDITSHSSSSDYADTFYGNYGRIIEAIKAKSPNSVIFISKGAGRTETWEAYRYAIDEISGHYDLCLIDQREADFVNSPIYTNMLGYHPSAFGYSQMSIGIEKLMLKYFEENWQDFRTLFYN